MLSFTDLLQSGEKPVPFRNRYYFPTLIFPVTPPTKPIKVPAIEPSFPVTDSSPTEEGRTPEQTPKIEDSESQPKVTISLTHSLTHRQTDRQTHTQLVTMVPFLSLQKGNQSRQKKPTKVMMTPSIPVTDSSPTDEVHTPTQSQPKVTISLTHIHIQTDTHTTSDNGY